MPPRICEMTTMPDAGPANSPVIDVFQDKTAVRSFWAQPYGSHHRFALISCFDSMAALFSRPRKTSALQHKTICVPRSRPLTGLGFELAAGLGAVVISTGCERMIGCWAMTLTARLAWMTKRKYGIHSRYPFCVPIKAKPWRRFEMPTEPANAG